jgi:hypothetical protein
MDAAGVAAVAQTEIDALHLAITTVTKHPPSSIALRGNPRLRTSPLAQTTQPHTSWTLQEATAQTAYGAVQPRSTQTRLRRLPRAIDLGLDSPDSLLAAETMLNSSYSYLYFVPRKRRGDAAWEAEIVGI